MLTTKFTSTAMFHIPAGTWHLVGDGELISGNPVVRFDLIWKSGTTQTTIAQTSHRCGPV